MEIKKIKFWEISKTVFRILTLILLIIIASALLEMGEERKELEDKDYIIIDHNATKRGEHFPQKGIIVIYGYGKPVWMVDEIYIHERCHFVWHNQLNDTLREEYIEIYENATWSVSGYAKKNVLEDFAETCKYYIVMNKIGTERTPFFMKIHDNLQLVRMRKP